MLVQIMPSAKNKVNTNGATGVQATKMSPRNEQRQKCKRRNKCWQNEWAQQNKWQWVNGVAVHTDV